MIASGSLRSLALFDGLAPEALRIIATRGGERSFASGQVLFKAGDDARGLFVVTAGRVRVTRRRAGRGQIVHVEGPGGTLGEIPLFTGAPFPATATAVEPSRCLVFTKAAVRDAIAADPELALRLLARLGERVRGLIARLDRLAFTSVRARLAAFIADRATASLGAVVSLGLTHTQLADELGTVREVVVKELAALRRAGVILPRGAGRVEVVDRAALDAAISARATSARRAPARGGAARDARRPSAGR